MKLPLDDLGKCILRLAGGGILLFHGVFKVFTDIEHVKRLVETAGLPAVLAYGSIIGEFIAPIFVIIGYKTRLAALIMVINMLMTIVVAHRDLVFERNDFGGWMIETNMLFLSIALTIAFLGAGRYSLSKGKGLWD
ncbi:MAG TPA: DoxX family protein [Ohtaekwangia sp.]|uniref:DoxX family protein n=1 Tax=Ohtaekwangia sp. TaxID=2066019 RepID=UPI002F91C67A